VDGVQSWQAPLIEANPMDKLDRVRLPSPAPHGLGPGQVEAILVVMGCRGFWNGIRRQWLFGP
jgi:hypothetical protein